MLGVGLRVAFLSAECEPWAKTGGLADVVDALARAIGRVPDEAAEMPVDVFLPRYRGVPDPRPDAILTETVVAVPDADLPVVLPKVAEFSGRGDSPLAHVPAFVDVVCPTCGGPARRERRRRGRRLSAAAR